jgi:hypothetical protein
MPRQQRIVSRDSTIEIAVPTSTLNKTSALQRLKTPFTAHMQFNIYESYFHSLRSKPLLLVASRRRISCLTSSLTFSLSFNARGSMSGPLRNTGFYPYLASTLEQE